jgi:hypothetical protein
MNCRILKVYYISPIDDDDDNNNDDDNIFEMGSLREFYNKFENRHHLLLLAYHL